MKVKISLFNFFIFFLFYLSPIIDSLSGFLILSHILQEGSAGTPSQLFRLLLILIMILLLKRKTYFYTALLFVLYITFIESFFALFHSGWYGYIIGLVYSSKIFYLLLIFLTLHYFYTIQKIDFMRLLFLNRNYFFISALLICIPFFLGIGFNTYKEGTFGFKGFFAAGNGLGIFMGTGLLLTIYYWRIVRDLYSLFIVMVVFFSTIIIGSKTVLIFGAIATLFIIFSFRNRIVSYSFFIVMLSTIVYFSHEIFNVLKIIFDVILYRYENNPSFSSFLMSSRDVFFTDAIKNISFEGIYLFRFFLGFGAYISFRDPSSTYQSIDSLESDLSDLFFMYGMIMLIIYLVFMFYILIKSISKKIYSLSLIFGLLLIHSLIAGHVMFNGMSGVMIPIVSLLILSYKKPIDSNLRY